MCIAALTYDPFDVSSCLDDQARVAAAKEKVESDMFNKQTFLHYEEALRDIEIPLSA